MEALSMIEIARRVLTTEAEAIESLIGKLDGGFEKAVDIIFSSRGRVIVTGIGKSGIVGKKIAATLASTGTPAFFMHPVEASHGDLGMVTRDDVIIAISNSGETEELAGLIPFLKRFDLGLISLTGNPDSTIARAADVNIDISVKEEACTLGIVPTSSTTATMAMGDAIAVALLIRRRFRREDFAFFHPSGTLGKRLFVRVKDLMHSGSALPLVMPETPMIGAVIEISSKRLGVTVVQDRSGRMLGIITDGDVRRGVEKWGKDFFDMTAEEAMTRGPRTILPDELAARALSEMEKHSITSLIVSDGEGGAAGIIHLHDILRQGIS
jgi:arabinose-5-phosphate isomerase